MTLRQLKDAMLDLINLGQLPGAPIYVEDEQGELHELQSLDAGTGVIVMTFKREVADV